MRYFRPLIMMLLNGIALYAYLERISAGTDRWYTWLLLAISVWMTLDSLETIDKRANAHR